MVFGPEKRRNKGMIQFSKFNNKKIRKIECTMLLELYLTFFKAESGKILLMMLGGVARRYRKLKGPLTLIMVDFLMFVAIPAENASRLWDLDLSKIADSFMVLLPFWLLKVFISLIAFYIFHLSDEVPSYFRWIVVAVLVSDSETLRF